MQALRAIVVAIFSLLKNTGSWSINRFKTPSNRGKAVMGCGGLLAVCFACSACSVVTNTLPDAIGITPTTHPTNTRPPTAVSAPTPPPDQPAGQTATVTAVIDGDTIDVRIDGITYRVRYIGMDTPERGDPFYTDATDANAALVSGQTVILVKDVSETDRYGRLLRYVYLQDGIFVNAELVRQGVAQIATYPPDVAHQETFLHLQQEARAAGIGLWATFAADPVNTPSPPHTFTPSPLTPSSIQISTIFYDGAVSRVESDEYAVITNNGGTAVNLNGWRLNAGSEGQDFIFPDMLLQPGQSCRVYTNQIHDDSCGGGTFGSGRALWNNGGDCGYIFDNNGVQESEYCY